MSSSDRRERIGEAPQVLVHGGGWDARVWPGRSVIAAFLIKPWAVRSSGEDIRADMLGAAGNARAVVGRVGDRSVMAEFYHGELGE
eukprot:1753883-Alexandrium_andersonii.AAC.1